MAYLPVGIFMADASLHQPHITFQTGVVWTAAPSPTTGPPWTRPLWPASYPASRRTGPTCWAAAGASRRTCWAACTSGPTPRPTGSPPTWNSWPVTRSRRTGPAASYRPSTRWAWAQPAVAAVVWAAMDGHSWAAGVVVGGAAAQPHPRPASASTGPLDSCSHTIPDSGWTRARRHRKLEVSRYPCHQPFLGFFVINNSFWTSVADSYHIDTDPNTDRTLIRIRIQGKNNSVPGKSNKNRSYPMWYGYITNYHFSIKNHLNWVKNKLTVFNGFCWNRFRIIWYGSGFRIRGNAILRIRIRNTALNNDIQVGKAGSTLKGQCHEICYASFSRA